MRFIVKRLLLTIPILFLVSILAFTLIHLIPGDPARVILGEEATPQAYEALRQQLNLDKPIIVQYLMWMGNVLQGNLGMSIISHVPVSQLIAQRLPATI